MVASRASPGTRLARATGRCFRWASERRCAGSELVALSLGDIETVPGRGLRILVRRSKTDQLGQGQEIALWANPDQPGFWPLAAVNAWLVHRRTAADLDWTASAASRAEHCYALSPGLAG
jgi:hypothetical protein